MVSRKTEIAAVLRDELRAARYRPGERLPRVADLCARFDVTTATAVYAVRILVDEGWVSSEPGRGYFATTDPPVDDVAGVVDAIDHAMEALRLAKARLLSNTTAPAPEKGR